MGVPTTAMPLPAVIDLSYGEALNVVYSALKAIPSQPGTPSVYAVAVYNLASDILVRSAQDQPTNDPPTYWADLRSALNIGSFTPGFLNAAADQGTSQAMIVPETLLQMTMGNLLLMQTPWGRAYLGIISSWGTLWGIS